MSVDQVTHGPKYWEVIDKLSAEIADEISNYPLATKIDKRKIVSKILSKNLRVLMREHILTQEEINQSQGKFVERIHRKNVEEISDKLKNSPLFFNQIKQEFRGSHDDYIFRSCLVVLAP